MPAHSVIIADDDRHLVDVLKTYLEAEGFVVFTATDGRPVVGLAKNRQPSLIVLDIDMPFLSGLDVLKALRKDPATRLIPVIVLSGLASDQVFPQVAGDPRSSHLKKPVSLEDFGSLVKTYFPE